MNEAHKRMKNLFIDFFKMSDSNEINVVQMQRIIVFTCQNNTSPVVCKHYEAGVIKEQDVKQNNLPELKEIGPSFSLALRRDRIASQQLFKEACRQPKVINVVKKNQDKNKFTNVLGETKGKVYIQQQDLRTIALKKYGSDKKSARKAAREKKDQIEAGEV